MRKFSELCARVNREGCLGVHCFRMNAERGGDVTVFAIPGSAVQQQVVVGTTTTR
jgi:hypothetical protein